MPSRKRTAAQIERIALQEEEENVKWTLWRSIQPYPVPHLPYDSQRGLRLLSLDGGGIRGITSLIILDHIMGRLGGPGEEALPCDYFDLICGTSTGGLIAIMLGRLRMSVKDCIKVFKDLGEEVFGLHKFGRGANLLDGHRFPADKLANAIKKTVWAYSEYHSEKTVMKDCRENACKTFVVAIRGCNVDAPNKRFRTYDNPFLSQSADSCAIWEAGRATACAPSYFPEIQIPANNGIIYADGALGYNNPVQQALSEARSL